MARAQLGNAHTRLGVANFPVDGGLRHDRATGKRQKTKQDLQG